MNHDKVVKINHPDGCRLICISDIHGSLSLFKKLLHKINLRDSDILMLQGDFIERGHENAATAEYLYSFQKRAGTYLLRGNLDTIGEYLLKSASTDDALHYFNKRFRNIVAELAARCGLSPVNEHNLCEVRRVLLDKYGRLFDFLKNLPVAYESDDHVFSHSGVAPCDEWRDAHEDFFVRNYDFYKNRVNKTEKTVIFGHMPTFNLPESGATDLPVILPEAGFIAIDGGNNVKSIGQLNALIIEKQNGDVSYSSLFADSSKKVLVVSDYEKEDDAPLAKTTHESYAVEVLERGEFFSICNTASHETGRVKNEYIRSDDGGKSFYAYNSISSFLDVKKGDAVYLLDCGCAGYCLVKNAEGLMGWVPRDTIDTSFTEDYA